MNSNRFFKPWLILPPKVLTVLLMILALVAMAVGVYTGFFATKGFESTTATIARIEEDENYVGEDPNDKQYIAYVTYFVDGREYTVKTLGELLPGGFTHTGWNNDRGSDPLQTHNNFVWVSAWNHLSFPEKHTVYIKYYRIPCCHYIFPMMYKTHIAIRRG